MTFCSTGVGVGENTFFLNILYGNTKIPHYHHNQQLEIIYRVIRRTSFFSAENCKPQTDVIWKWM